MSLRGSGSTLPSGCKPVWSRGVLYMCSIGPSVVVGLTTVGGLVGGAGPWPGWLPGPALCEGCWGVGPGPGLAGCGSQGWSLCTGGPPNYLMMILLTLPCMWRLASLLLLSRFNLCLFFLNYFWLRWVFVAARGLSLVVASGGYSLLPCTGFSLWWLLLLQSTGSRCVGFSSCGTQTLECRLSSCGTQA